MEKEKILIDYRLCMACGVCVQTCPFSCLDLVKTIDSDKYNNVYPELSKDKKCTGCGICKEACPIECIKLC